MHEAVSTRERDIVVKLLSHSHVKMSRDVRFCHVSWLKSEKKESSDPEHIHAERDRDLALHHEPFIMTHHDQVHV